MKLKTLVQFTLAASMMLAASCASQTGGEESNLSACLLTRDLPAFSKIDEAIAEEAKVVGRKSAILAHEADLQAIAERTSGLGAYADTDVASRLSCKFTEVQARVMLAEAADYTTPQTAMVDATLDVIDEARGYCGSNTANARRECALLNHVYAPSIYSRSTALGIAAQVPATDGGAVNWSLASAHAAAMTDDVSKTWRKALDAAKESQDGGDVNEGGVSPIDALEREYYAQACMTNLTTTALTNTGSSIEDPAELEKLLAFGEKAALLRAHMAAAMDYAQNDRQCYESVEETSCKNKLNQALQFACREFVLAGGN